MSNMYGADVEQLRLLGREFSQQAEQLEAIIGRISGRVDNAGWRGPDAEGFRSNWRSQLTVSIRSAMHILQDGSSQAIANAKQQEEASGGSAGGSIGTSPWGSTTVPYFPGDMIKLPTMPFMPGALPPGFNFQDFMNETDLVVHQGIGGLPFSLDGLNGIVPGVGDALNIRDLVDKVSDGQFPIHEIVDGASGLMQKAGPVGYWGGAAIKSWDLALTQLEKADLSQSGRDTTFSYMQSNPMDSLAAAGEAVVKFIPDILGIFK